MKKEISLILILFIFQLSFSQIDEKKTNYYFNCDYPGKNDINLKVINPVSKFNFAKFELKFENNSDNYIYFLKEECIFRYEEGDFSPPKKKLSDAVIVEPGAKKSPTLKVVGGTHFLTDEFEFLPGGVYTFSSEGIAVAAEDFHLPANKNQFTAGNFKIKMLRLKKETDETAVKFECFYKGDNIGIISPSLPVLKTENGKEWANERSDMKPRILKKGDKTSFVVIFKIPGSITDMQFAEMDIVWKNTFSESELEEIKFENKRIKIDTNKTEENN